MMELALVVFATFLLGAIIRSIAVALDVLMPDSLLKRILLLRFGA